MKKIVSCIFPFSLNQNIIIYDKDLKLLSTHSTVESMPETLVRLANTFDVNEIQLRGNQDFIKNIIDKTYQKELREYGVNKLHIISKPKI